MQALIFSPYMHNRSLVQQELECSLAHDLNRFDFVTVPPANSYKTVASAVSVGYDIAVHDNYKFVGRIDDDDLVIPGAFSLLLDCLLKNPHLDGVTGRQVRLSANSKRVCKLDPASQLIENPHYLLFHGITLYRTTALYPTVDKWRTTTDVGHHRLLAKMLIENQKKLGVLNCVVSFWRPSHRTMHTYLTQ